jgi:hypothetical protein
MPVEKVYLITDHKAEHYVFKWVLDGATLKWLQARDVRKKNSVLQKVLNGFEVFGWLNKQLLYRNISINIT